ncbi:hypothetical protein VB796_21050 [Arcicella sp. LKC2W]|uniref:hypothetical protein n=1 Tax=Arcicella sp. LKC2W TaxID=2984198 RepID=UPI002B205334|nr:hypothetical protein [Arcicella sp. LKC2W]MEA5461568.1 hypothetical protein [Arcicella sp. LKC2W]
MKEILDYLKTHSSILMLVGIVAYAVFFKPSESTVFLNDAQEKATQATLLAKETQKQAESLKYELQQAQLQLNVSMQIITKYSDANAALERTYIAEKRTTKSQIDSTLYYLNQLKQLQKAL